MKKQKQKIILYDLETSPLQIFSWGLWEQNALSTVKDWELLSFAYKDLHGKKITCVSRPQFNDKTDKSITKALHRVLDSADITIAHNGISYDKKKSNAKFLQYGLTPPKPSVMIDTLRVAKKNFKLSSNKLNDLGKLLRVGQKAQTGGFQLWLDVMNNVREGWRTMVRYNKQDVVLLEKVYLKLLPWIDNHPRINSDLDACPNCGGNHFQARGTVQTKTGAYRRFMCVGCGKWLRNRKSEKNQSPNKVSLS